MRLNEDGKTVAAMDVLVPRVGEIIGGSQREERLDVLLQMYVSSPLFSLFVSLFCFSFLRSDDDQTWSWSASWWKISNLQKYSYCLISSFAIFIALFLLFWFYVCFFHTDLIFLFAGSPRRDWSPKHTSTTLIWGDSAAFLTLGT